MGLKQSFLIVCSGSGMILQTEQHDEYSGVSEKGKITENGKRQQCLLGDVGLEGSEFDILMKSHLQHSHGHGCF